MRGLIPVVLGGLAVAIALSFRTDAPGQTDERAPAEFARVAERLLEVPGADDLMTRCPADIQDSLQSQRVLPVDGGAVT